MDIIIRAYKAADLPEVVNLFRETIHTVNAKDYTREQINAWAPEHIDAEKWGIKLLAHYTVIAEVRGKVCGFGDIDDSGYFDHLFVHKDYQGRGVATRIVNAIETYAVQKGFKTITVAVSITAKSFFLKQGYVVVKQQEVEYNGQVFTNYAMKKDLPARHII
jgi:putative acetyltransferase